MCEVMEKLMAESREKGKSEGTILTLVSLVNEGLLDVSIAAGKAEMSESEFRKLLV